MVVIDGKVDLDSGIANKVGDVIVDADEGRLEDYCRWNRKYADGTGSIPMERRSVRFPS